MLDVALDPASHPREGPAHAAGRLATLREAVHTSSSCVLCSIPVQASASGSPGRERALRDKGRWPQSACPSRGLGAAGAGGSALSRPREAQGWKRGELT